MVLRRFVTAATVIAVAPAGVGAQQADATPGFCARLAADLAMKPAKPVDGHATWEVNTLNAAQRLLIGGSSVISMRVEPVAAATVEEYKRLQGACEPTPKGAVCHVAGPTSFHVGAKGRVAKIEAAAGERAEVFIRGTRIRCEDR